jgi:Ca2+/Na+ antiporter
MNNKPKSRQDLTFFDYLILITILLNLVYLIRGDVNRFFYLGIITVAIVAQLIRLLIQKHNYRKMSPTEKEFYLDNCSPLAYQPSGHSKTIRNQVLFVFAFLTVLFGGTWRLIKGQSPLYSICLFSIAIIGLLIHLLIQKHSYQKMSPSEQELYRENISLLMYRPGK